MRVFPRKPYHVRSVCTLAAIAASHGRTSASMSPRPRSSGYPTPSLPARGEGELVPPRAGGNQGGGTGYELSDRTTRLWARKSTRDAVVDGST